MFTEQCYYVLIKEIHGGQSFLSEVKVITYESLKEDLKEKELSDFELVLLSRINFRYFEHKFLRYYFDTEHNDVHEISGLDDILTVQKLFEMSYGLSKSSTLPKVIIHGNNFINVPVRSYIAIFFTLALNPFYIFQAFSMTLWYNDSYYYYATIIVFMTLFSLVLNTYETKSHLQKLHDMVADATNVVVLENGNNGPSEVIKSSRDLVPGDVLLIPAEGMHLPCDAVLLNGRCVVNESTLTGESFPASKTGLDGNYSDMNTTPQSLSMNKHKRHALYNGTEVLQAHSYGEEPRIFAVVLRTGFCTLKGRLIRSILHPKPVHFTFFRDSMKFLLFVGVLAFFGFIYSLIQFLRRGASVSLIIRKSLDVFTIAIPPALPACMSVGLMYALYRLRKQQIYCIDPARVNVCGKVKMFVFDKTGTLTEDTLAVSGVVRCDNQVFHQIEHTPDQIQNSIIVKAMACCHNLTILKDHVIGDPLDTYMFNFTKWRLKLNDESSFKSEIVTPVTVSPPDEDPAQKKEVGTIVSKTIGILKQYPFESVLQRMSVITKQLDEKNMVVYAKGSPEMILSLCRDDSKPENILDVLIDFTKTGSRVLAIATKNLSELTERHHIKKISRAEIESDLTFLGLIVFENVLKPVSKSIIEMLGNANIRTIMATGDNLYTATSVAHEVRVVKSFQKVVEVTFDADILKYQILQHGDETYVQSVLPCEEHLKLDFNSLGYTIALSGNTYVRLRTEFPGLLPKILLSTSVFARMSPDQKTMLVEDLKEIGYGVGMCGDGANDCGALKAAHAGIALSDTEASVASPFTSKIFDISCVPQLLKEGRAALVTSFCIFKYMALYSFIQFIGVLILYDVNSNYSDFEFLYADLCLNLVLCFTMIQSKANKILTCKRPPGRLVHPIFIGGILLQTIVIFLFQFGVFLYVKQMPWYKPPTAFQENKGKELNFTCYENVAVITMSFFQYIWLSVVCTGGRPYRQPLYLNWMYVVAFVVTTISTIFLTLYPPDVIRVLLLFAKIPSFEFLGSLILISLINCGIAYLIDYVFLPSIFVKRLSNCLQGKTEPRNQYKHIYNELQQDTHWPPVL